MKALKPRYKKIGPSLRTSKSGRTTRVKSHVRNVARRKK